MKNLFPTLSLIPVVVIDDPAHAVPFAEALLEGGVNSIEITLRTEAGLPAIESIAKALPEMLVGSGTITNSKQLQAAIDAGARFHVSPGITATLAEAAQNKGVAWLPGSANASDIMLAMDYGITHVKLFPAGIAGGVAMLKQIASVFPQIQVCPTGGVNLQNLADFAVQPNVFAIGGSWLAPKDSMRSGDWARITEIAKESVSALSSSR